MLMERIFAALSLFHAIFSCLSTYYTIPHISSFVFYITHPLHFVQLIYCYFSSTITLLNNECRLEGVTSKSIPARIKK